MDVFEMLKSDHQTVRQIFNRLNLVSGGQIDNDLLQQLRFELNTHAELEENIFYPACDKYNELKDLIRDSYKDHKEVKAMLMKLSSFQSDNVVSQLQQLMNDVETHVMEEETQLFPLCQKVMPRHELEQIGRDMEHAKRQAGVQRQGRVASQDY